ncbi:MAG TPA: SUMF1/EgtB/PvdO family nonheme iron enzyme [Thermoanaerobaculia bacterium]|jgi:formylglycine-generating enzyme required for sulfatase activity/Mrp family chromosome partitioning ATPase|nr:SUMF1/EgtB/PvdO family nonheme iron enzyme [Thermoanaerobaculia bacterium]
MSGTVITFYSYKGGVGRTQALANVGTLLSVWGFRVLCIDWDLEAPGLHRYFERWLTDRDAEGLVELITKHGAGEATDWRRFIQTISFPQETKKEATLDFLPAGRFDAGYVARLQALNWDALYRERHLGEWIEALRTDWKEEYDFVLIDSRTGITDLGGICTIQLPDILVLLFTANQQSLDGVLDVAHRASERQGNLPFDRTSLPCVPVPTRFESRVELEIAKEWLEVFATRLIPLYRHWLAASVEPRQLLDVLRLPYVPYWSFGEKMPVLDEGIRDPESLGYALATLAALLVHQLDQTELLVAKRDDFVDAALDSGAAARRTRDGLVIVGGDLVAGNIYINSGGPGSFVEEAALRNAYLSSIVARSQGVPISAIDRATTAETRLNVEAIYTPLATRTSEIGKPFFRFQSALAQLNLHPRLVLLGEPGSGKSTFARFLALCMAGEALDLPNVNLRRLTDSLPGSSPENVETWDHGALLPVWISLRDLVAAADLNWRPAWGSLSDEPGTAQQLWAYIERDLTDSGLGEYANRLRSHLLTQGGLLILDGLDEVPSAEGRRNQVGEAIQSFAASFARCQVLVTCRSYAYRNQGWRLQGFSEAELAPFDADRISHFIHRWYVNAAASGQLSAEDAAGRADLLGRAIQASDRLRDLAERPLLLTLIASLHSWRGGSLPERREELYADAVDLLLDTWEGRRTRRDAQGQLALVLPAFSDFLKVDREAVRVMLEELAFEAHSRQSDFRGTADIGEDELLAKLLKLTRNSAASPAHLLDYLRDRSGLLVPRGEGVYAFPHRTFQEYLAACYLTRKNFPDQMAELTRTNPLRWGEVALLAGARAARGTSVAVWVLADALCWREPDDQSAGIEDSWGALIAGQLIAESANLSGISQRYQTKLEHFRHWLVKVLREKLLPPTERAFTGRTLAALGDSRSEVMTVDGLEFLKVKAGRFFMGSNEKDAQASENERPQHEVDLPEFRVARYPVTVAQYREYLRARGLGDETESLDGDANAPAVGVNWYQAIAFCDWLTLRWHQSGRLESGWRVGLPSEAEWEKAARGHDARLYPWGTEVETERANFVATGIGSASTVGCFPDGASPFACEEMSGNVWEWTRSLWGRSWQVPDFAYPYDLKDGREDLNAPGEVLRILRGGSYINESRDIRCSSRTGLPSESRNDGVGFRVVLIPAESAYSSSWKTSGDV